MKFKSILAGIVFGAFYSSSSVAGVYTDDLSKCLVSATTKEDRIALVRWMFAAASAHPAVKSISAVTPEQLDETNKNIGELFMRLTTESCREQTKNALSYEGILAIQGGFQVLGEVAGQEMFASPEVASGMAGLEKYIDNQAFESLMSENN